MRPHSRKYGSQDPPKRYVSPIGSLWKKSSLDKHPSVSGYRRETSPSARFKFALDIAAAVYLVLVVFSLIANAVDGPSGTPSLRTLVWKSSTSLLDTFAYIFTLQPLISFFGLGQTSIQRSQLIAFALLLGLILVHESSWLKEWILYSAATSASTYEGFLVSKKPKTRDWLTTVSSIVNHLFIIGVLVTGASFLWSARNLPVTRDPLAQPRLLSAGMFLTIIGAFNVIKALESRSDPKSGGWIETIGLADAVPARVINNSLNAIAAAFVSGTAFASIVMIGLRRGREQGKLAFIFGFTFVLIAWIVRQLIVHPTETPQPWNISRKQLKTRGERLLHYGVQVPLMALGWVVNPALIVIEFIAVRIQRLLAKSAGWIAYRAKPILPYSLYMWLWRISAAETIERHNDEAALQLPTIQIVAQSDRGAVGYDLRARPMQQADGVDKYLRKKYLHELLEGNTWLTRWVKREPARLVTKAAGGGWDREDPLDFKREVRRISTNWPTTAEFNKLFRHLIALMLAVSFVAYTVKFVVGHLVAAYGRPLFERGLWYAVLFALIVGLLFAVVTMWGKSSLSGLALGLVSGLALAPKLGAAEGLTVRAANEGMTFLMGFAVTLLTSMLGDRVLVIGVLIFLLGVYLQGLQWL